MIFFVYFTGVKQPFDPCLLCHGAVHVTAVLQRLLQDIYTDSHPLHLSLYVYTRPSAVTQKTDDCSVFCGPGQLPISPVESKNHKGFIRAIDLCTVTKTPFCSWRWLLKNSQGGNCAQWNKWWAELLLQEDGGDWTEEPSRVSPCLSCSPHSMSTRVEIQNELNLSAQ